MEQFNNRKNGIRKQFTKMNQSVVLHSKWPMSMQRERDVTTIHSISKLSHSSHLHFSQGWLCTLEDDKLNKRQGTSL